MHRTLRTATLSLAVTAVVLAAPAVVLAAPAVAIAAPAVSAGGISAVADDAPLDGNPWNPGANTHVVVHNRGAMPAQGYFLLTLPEGTELGATDICDPATAGDTLHWVCGGDEIPAGADRSYLIRVNTSAGEPQFGKSALGYVTGRTADGRLGRRNDFLITWPQRMPLRLSVNKGRSVAGTTQVRVRATNAGSFAIGGYSLDVRTPGTVTVDDSCVFVPELGDGGCRVNRMDTLAAGATDTFTLTITVTGGRTAVGFALTPARRYTNRDTRAVLVLR